MDIAQFRMPCTEEAPRRFVASFFRTNDAYLNLNAQAPLVGYDDETEVECLVRMYSDTDAEAADDRRLALELQIADSVPLASKYIDAILFPKELQTASWLCEFFSGRGAGIKQLTYSLSPLRKASDYQALLEERVSDFQLKQSAP